MTQNPATGPVVPVKAQPNVYTVLLIIAVIVLAVAAGICLNNLMGNYGMEFGQIFDPSFKVPVK
jgi:hypothetical protein